MPVYNFKGIKVVPTSKDFIDIVLSKTQRKTPTVVHQGYAIGRIRKFYMRKVKFADDAFTEKITQILDDFPRLDDIHPFYSDLINVLYSRDHYKLALGQISTARTLVSNIAKDYLKLLKFGDSLYRCKELKRAALGRMCTVMSKLGPSLSYLEQVRQHLSRLPSIDPSTRTVMITGTPNVGKTSFINKVSNTNGEVQPYAFTTKSLFVGHFDYKYMRWQVIDTPGILDHPLEDRNIIEMQAITALARLHSSVLFFLDISEQCGYSLKNQVSLFHSIKPLFANKPIIIVANKQDVRRWDDLDAEDKALIEGMKDGRNISILPMSNMTEEGITNVLHSACDLLLQHRVEKKLKSNSQRVNEVLNRIQVTTPIARDNKVRGTAIPQSVVEQRASESSGVLHVKRRTEKDIEAENGGAGVYNIDLKKFYILKHEEWKYDLIPEIMDGHNVADFVDPDIDRKLAELEAEEEMLRKEYEERKQQGMEDANADDDLDEEQKAALAAIRKNRRTLIADRRFMRTNNKPVLPRTARRQEIDAVKENLKEMGHSEDVLEEKFAARARSRSKVRGTKRSREDMDDVDDFAQADAEMADASNKKSKQEIEREASRARSLSRLRSTSRDHKRVVAPSPFRDEKAKKEATKQNFKGQRKIQRHARQGESDRRVLAVKPKHLYTGTTSIGKRDRR